MTLQRRLTVQISLTLGGVLLLAGGALLAIHSLRSDVTFALQANQQLRAIYDFGARLATSRSAISAAQIESGRELLNLSISESGGWLDGTQSQVSTLQTALDAAVHAGPDSTAVSRCFSAIADLSAATRQALVARQLRADRAQRLATIGVLSLAALISGGFIMTGIRHYRAVLRPVRALQQTARSIASGQLDARVHCGGDAEFVSLAGDFNRMAEQLQTLCTTLQKQVDIKSRELAQSARLASVGYLAAGVAHEINNPLAIIAGFGQRALKKLDSADSQSVAHSLSVMCDEAFRCKKITDQLLSLANPNSSQQRQSVSLAQIVQQVIATIAGLRPLSARQIQFEGDHEICVRADSSQIHQVILNLIINAIDATDPSRGRVAIKIHSGDQTAVLTVTDNGKGIDPADLLHLYDPFFTRKDSFRSGTGLGLTLAHAIITDHGGTLSASSEGPDRGATFIVRLPQEIHAHA